MNSGSGEDVDRRHGRRDVMRKARRDVEKGGVALRVLDDLRTVWAEDFRWNVLIRPRLEGLPDAEYLWEPAPGTLTVRLDGKGRFLVDEVLPDTVPLGNIAWRMAHLTATLSNHPVATVAFGPAWPKPDLAAAAGTANEALARLDSAYAHWQQTVASTSLEDLARRLGPKAGPYANSTVLGLIQHLQAETLQRGADLCLLRDLYAHQSA